MVLLPVHSPLNFLIFPQQNCGQQLSRAVVGSSFLGETAAFYKLVQYKDP